MFCLFRSFSQLYVVTQDLPCDFLNLNTSLGVANEIQPKKMVKHSSSVD